jgi:anti-sigma factor RsiW
MREIERAISDDDLQAYVDECLDPVRLPAVEAEIAMQPELATRVAAYRQQRQHLRQAFAQAVPPRPEADRALMRLAETRQRNRHTRRLLAAVAMIAVVIGTGSGWMLHDVAGPMMSRHGDMVGIAALADEASSAHLVFAADHKRPVEMDAAHAQDLCRWLSNRLAHPVIAADLAEAGYRFMGGRLVATSHGPAALFMYDDDKGTRLTLLIRPMADADMQAPMEPVTANGVDGYAWAKHGMGFSLVGATASDKLQHAAEEVQRQSKTGI